MPLAPALADKSPYALYANPVRIQAAVGEVLAQFGAGTGHIFNLGHGIHPDVDPRHVAVLVDAVHELSRPYHAPRERG